MEDQILIPRKGRAFVAQHAQRIRPLLAAATQSTKDYLAEGGPLYFLEVTCDDFSHSYPWSAKRLGMANDEIAELARIVTYHAWGYYGFFKPSVAEVLQQIPEHLLPEVAYFLVLGPDDSADLNAQADVIKQGYHQAVTILYAGREHG